MNLTDHSSHSSLLVIGSCFPGMKDVASCNFSCWVPNLCNVLNQFVKSLRTTARNVKNLLALFIFPLVQLYFISNAAGRLPSGLAVGYVIDDQPASECANTHAHVFPDSFCFAWLPWWCNVVVMVTVVLLYCLTVPRHLQYLYQWSHQLWPAVPRRNATEHHL